VDPIAEETVARMALGKSKIREGILEDSTQHESGFLKVVSK
jgi:hypothetical protein